MSRRVLLIEDEDDIREVAQLTLETTAGWEVAVASNGPDGLRAAREIPPELVLLDVMMPGMDGPTTLQRLRGDAATQHVPVVFLTAKIQESEHARLMALGAVAVILKPFDPMMLAAQVRSVMGWKED